MKTLLVGNTTVQDTRKDLCRHTVTIQTKENSSQTKKKKNCVEVFLAVNLIFFDSPNFFSYHPRYSSKRTATQETLSSEILQANLHILICHTQMKLDLCDSSRIGVMFFEKMLSLLVTS